MKIVIIYTLRDDDVHSYGTHFKWAADEDFTNLIDTAFDLFKMKAADIIQMKELSEYDKILLSAVAGAAFQYIIDSGDVDLADIDTCRFIIVEEE